MEHPMSRMLPPYIKDCNRGEAKVFELFKHAPGTEDWYVLHSYNLPDDCRGMGKEIDFVVIAPGQGIFCLEVKSGQVEKKDGLWIVSDGRGNSYTSRRSPFRQAKEACHCLAEKIKEAFGARSRQARLMCGHGVVFPSINFDILDPEIAPWTVCDRRKLGQGIGAYIKDLSQGFSKTYEGYPWFDDFESKPGKKEAGQLKDFLRGDFQVLLTPRQKRKQIEAEIARFTQEQYACLDALEDNPRCLFKGAAGTGKTMLALETAKASIWQGKNTLVICFNILLGQWLHRQLEKLGQDHYYAGPFLEYLEQITGTSSKDLHDLDHYYRKQLPCLALQALKQGKVEPYDTLVVDEGQDLLGEHLIQVMDKMLKGGLKEGNWYFFCDFERQNIFSTHKEAKKMLDLLNNRTDFVSYRLSFNCRNTKQIAEDAYRLTGYKAGVALKEQLRGNPVQYYFFRDQAHQAALLENVLQALSRQEVPPQDITILSSRRLENSCACLLDQSAQLINLSQNPEQFFGRKKITFGTVHKFKGMENCYILLVDLEHTMHEDSFKTLLYVGMSRAKMELTVFMDEQLKSRLNTSQV